MKGWMVGGVPYKAARGRQSKRIGQLGKIFLNYAI